MYVFFKKELFLIHISTIYVVKSLIRSARSALWFDFIKFQFNSLIYNFKKYTSNTESNYFSLVCFLSTSFLFDSVFRNIWTFCPSLKVSALDKIISSIFKNWKFIKYFNKTYVMFALFY